MRDSGITVPPAALCVFSRHTTPRAGKPAVDLRHASRMSSRIHGAPARLEPGRTSRLQRRRDAAELHAVEVRARLDDGGGAGLRVGPQRDRFDIVPLTVRSPASLPSISAESPSSSTTVGSPSRESSPSGAVSIARSISSVGMLRVSLRRSITVPPAVGSGLVALRVVAFYLRPAQSASRWPPTRASASRPCTSDSNCGTRVRGNAANRRSISSR